MQASPNTRVLILDDVPEVRGRLCGLVSERRSCRALCCSADPTEALAAYDAHRPHAVIMDVRAHDPHGLALLKSIHERNAGCVIIALTHEASVEFVQACEARGAKHVLAKSREFERAAELVDALRENA